jgi:hypothetical protein
MGGQLFTAAIRGCPKNPENRVRSRPLLGPGMALRAFSVAEATQLSVLSFLKLQGNGYDLKGECNPTRYLGRFAATANIQYKQ